MPKSTLTLLSLLLLTVLASGVVTRVLRPTSAHPRNTKVTAPSLLLLNPLIVVTLVPPLALVAPLRWMVLTMVMIRVMILVLILVLMVMVVLLALMVPTKMMMDLPLLPLWKTRQRN